MSELFMAYGQYKTMLSEGQLDEAGAWEKVKSAFGKGMSGVKTANDAINKLGALAQNTAPVQGFDAKADALINKIGDANPKVKELTQKYGEWAKKNPVKQGLIIGMLTAVASLVAGPAGGAAAGYVLRAGNELLKGEKASTAIGKGVKGAAVGALAGAAAGAITGPIADMLKGIRIKDIPLPEKPDFLKYTITLQGKDHNVTILKSDREHLNAIKSNIAQLSRVADSAGSEIQKYNLLGKIDTKMWDLKNALYDLVQPDYQQKIAQMAKDSEFARQAAIDNDATMKAINAAAKTINAAAQGAATSGLADKAAAKAVDAGSKVGTGAAPAKPATAAPAPKATAQPAAASDKRADLKARQQAWQAQQRRIGKLK